jgi:4-amino-4-deoxy-L-arabinose transferase-like glycosyltransferase
VEERGKQVSRLGGSLIAGRRWWWWIAGCTAIGLVIRIGAVLGRPNRPARGDAYFYHNAANLLVAGKGFINPFIYAVHPHSSVPTAAFPPGFMWILAGASLVGFKTYFAHRIWCAIIGAAAVALCGLVAREIAGERAGIIAAFLVAVYPNIWMSDDLGMSETLSPIIVAVVLFAAYRFWRRPGWRQAVWLGASIGVAALVRDELALLGLFIVVPLVLRSPSQAWSRRGMMLGAATLSALIVVGPWVGYNLSRFKDPTFISTGLGVTLASANCPDTWSGPMEGYWELKCAMAAPINPNVDESVQGSEAQTYALNFIRSHESRFVPVELARLGRGFGFFHPVQQVQLDSFIEGRPQNWAYLGLGMYYGMLALSVGGAIVLRRRGIPVFPLWAIGLTVAASMLLTFGQTRYRSTFEVSLVLLSGVALGWIWDRLSSKRSAGLAEQLVPGVDEPDWGLSDVGMSLPSK